MTHNFSFLEHQILGYVDDEPIDSSMLSLIHNRSDKLDVHVILFKRSDISCIIDIIHCLNHSIPFIIIDSAWPELYQNRIIDMVTHNYNDSFEDCFFIATSGTTSMPKIVVHRISSVFVSARRSLDHQPIHSDARFIVSLSLATMGGILSLVKALVSDVVFLFTKGLWLNLIDSPGLYCFALVPQQLQRLSDYIQKHPSYLNRIDFILTGGDFVLNTLHSTGLKLLLPVVYSYGSTETCGQVSGTNFYLPQYSSGAPLNNVSIDSIDGRLWIQTDTNALGYFTDDQFISLPLHNDGFLTNDIVDIQSDSQFIILGRVDFLFQSGSYLINPFVIEHCILSHESILYACVIPVNDMRLGQVPLAFIDANLDEELLVDFCRNELPDYMVPKKWLPWPTSIAYDQASARRLLMNYYSDLIIKQ